MGSIFVWRLKTVAKKLIKVYYMYMRREIRRESKHLQHYKLEFNKRRFTPVNFLFAESVLFPQGIEAAIAFALLTRIKYDNDRVQMGTVRTLARKDSTFRYIHAISCNVYVGCFNAQASMTDASEVEGAGK